MMRGLRKLSIVELKLFVRDPMTMVFTFAFPLVVLVVLAGVFGNTPEIDDETGEPVFRGVGPTNYYVPAYIALTIASVGLIALPVRIAGYRELGVLRRYRASSAPLASVLGAQVVTMLLLTAVGSTLLIVLGFVAYDISSPESTGLVALGFLLVAVSFSAIGLLLGAVMPSARAAQGIGLVLFFVMMFLCGAGPPRDVMSSGMQVVGDWLPMTYAITVLQDPWLGFGWDAAGSAIVFAVAIACGAAALRFFRWE
jgi:ABC-2 type transport system permease protein